MQLGPRFLNVDISFVSIVGLGVVSPNTGVLGSELHGKVLMFPLNTETHTIVDECGRCSSLVTQGDVAVAVFTSGTELCVHGEISKRILSLDGRKTGEQKRHDT